MMNAIEQREGGSANATVNRFGVGLPNLRGKGGTQSEEERGRMSSARSQECQFGWRFAACAACSWTTMNEGHSDVAPAERLRASLPPPHLRGAARPACTPLRCSRASCSCTPAYSSRLDRLVRRIPAFRCVSCRLLALRSAVLCCRCITHGYAAHGLARAGQGRRWAEEGWDRGPTIPDRTVFFARALPPGRCGWPDSNLC